MRMQRHFWSGRGEEYRWGDGGSISSYPFFFQASHPFSLLHVPHQQWQLMSKGTHQRLGCLVKMFSLVTCKLSDGVLPPTHTHTIGCSMLFGTLALVLVSGHMIGLKDLLALTPCILMHMDRSHKTLLGPSLLIALFMVPHPIPSCSWVGLYVCWSEEYNIQVMFSHGNFFFGLQFLGESKRRRAVDMK